MRATCLPILTGLVFLAVACEVTGTPPGGGGPQILEAVPEGALVITELLAYPNVGRPEFVEIQNASESTVQIQGCEIADLGTGEHSFSINNQIELAPGQ